MSKHSYDRAPSSEHPPAVFTVPQQDVTNSKEPLVHEHTALHEHIPLNEAGWWNKLIPYLIVVPMIISIVIGSLQLLEYADSKNSLYEWSVTSRALVQVFVHVLSTLLSVLWVYPLCTVISYWRRNRLAERYVNLNTVRLWSAFTQAQTEWNLPWAFALFSFVFFTIMYVPATLWAGALTPSFTLNPIDHGLSLASE
jgi:hypothetical protein